MAPASPFPQANRDLIDRLQRVSSDVLADLVPSDTRFALIDFPNHDNVGDTAIYLGELAYLKRRGLRASYAMSALKADPDDIVRAIGDGPILLHGGGNFGDVWPAFQIFREKIMARFKGRPIVQLPQTMYYSTQAGIDRTARVIAEHGAFTLLVRDQASFDVASRNFDCDVRLCPDMAYHIGPIAGYAPTHELMMLMRTDHEAAAGRGDLIPEGDVVTGDWPKEPKPFKWSRYAVMAGATVAMRPFQSPGLHREMRYDLLSRARMHRGLKILSRGRAILTDRLHGHIIATLLGRPQAVLDNSYGKVSGLMNTWGTRLPNVHVAATVGEAIAVLREREGLAL